MFGDNLEIDEKWCCARYPISAVIERKSADRIDIAIVAAPDESEDKPDGPSLSNSLTVKKWMKKVSLLQSMKLPNNIMEVATHLPAVPRYSKDEVT